MNPGVGAPAKIMPWKRIARRTRHRCFLGEAWFDPIEAELRQRIRGFLEEMIEQEATAAQDAAVTSGARLRATGTAYGLVAEGLFGLV